MERACVACGVVKPIDDFHRHPRGRFGRNNKCKPCQRLSDQRRYARDREKRRAQALMARYGLKPGEYEQMLEAQGGMCSLCGKPCPTGRALAVDHCHETGLVRELLCKPCNNGLGHFNDDPDLMVRASEYVRRHRGRARRLPAPVASSSR